MVAFSNPSSRRATAPHVSLYPLARPALFVGAIAAILVGVVFTDAFAGFLVLCLAIIVGQSWRSDMIPALPFVLAYQWVSITAGYFFYTTYGFFPGGGHLERLHETIAISMLGLFGLMIGIRMAMHYFSKTVTRVTQSSPHDFDIPRAFGLTVIAFAVSFVFDVVPTSIWFGGAQIVSNLLAMRFIPYFILLVTVFRRGTGYSYAAAATAIVILPELLTGFSRFKEVLFVVLIAAAAQWNPWIKTRAQSRQNRFIFLFGTLGAVVVLAFGLIWSGGLKAEWRNTIWNESVEGSPIDRMFLFFKTAERTLGEFDLEQASETLAGRFSSGTLYFSYVVDRVPDTVPHEDGRLFGKAIANAVMPRFLFPDKANLGGDSWLVREYAGIEAAGNESNTSIGLGYMSEFYIDFGIAGVLGLCLFYGLTVGSSLVLLARAVPYRDIFFAITAGLLTQYLLSADGSFIKLFAGLLQRVLIAAAFFAILGSTLVHYLTKTPGRRSR